MINKKKIIWGMTSAIFFGLAVFAGVGINDYLAYQKTAEAAGSMPWQDGGKVTAYLPVCTLNPSGVCSCPLCSTTPCNGYTQISYKGQKGGMYICPKVGFAYKGGGAIPSSGMAILVGGASPIAPWVIGIPSTAGNTMQRLAETFNNFIIAGKKSFE